jgi:hypothetical protein
MRQQRCLLLRLTAYWQLLHVVCMPVVACLLAGGAAGRATHRFELSSTVAVAGPKNNLLLAPGCLKEEQQAEQRAANDASAALSVAVLDCVLTAGLHAVPACLQEEQLQQEQCATEQAAPINRFSFH